MDEEHLQALINLSTRLGEPAFWPDQQTKREGFWALYLGWLFHERKGDQPGPSRHERKRTVRDLDLLYGRRVTCEDLIQIARMHNCDMFDIVLIMPTVVEDLIELRCL